MVQALHVKMRHQTNNTSLDTVLMLPCTPRLSASKAILPQAMRSHTHTHTQADTITAANVSSQNNISIFSSVLIIVIRLPKSM